METKTTKTIYTVGTTKLAGVAHLETIQTLPLSTAIDYHHVDYLLFTSKKAVAIAYGLCSELKKLPSIAIGPATSKAITDLGGTLFDETQSYYAQRLADYIAKHYATKKLLYLRPKKTASEALNIANVEHKIIYETVCNRLLNAPKPNSILIFASPSAYSCFVEQFGWHSSYIAVAIGATTHKAFDPAITAHISPKPLLRSAYQFALTL